MKQLLVIFFLFLSLLCGCTTDADRSRMRSGLDSINQRNRNDQPFTVADVQPYADFFDRHGTSNDRLLAHYLLGRAYYEAGEAPMALQCYQQAIECADTTAKDCDFAQLCRVYAQMAEVFYYQNLYQEQLHYEKLSVKHAWQAKDTLAALMNYEQESFAYKKLGFPDSAIIVIEDVARRYHEYGYPRNAAISLGTIVRTLVERGDYKKAKEYMEVYESESGYFSPDGAIMSGREIYYYVKGLYYLHNNMLDSAEYWYRKELNDGKDFNNQKAGAMGLATLYQSLSQPDSSAKYAVYAYAMNDSMYARKTTTTIERMQAMYDYSHHQEKAYDEERKASQRAVAIWICLGIIVVVCLFSFIIIRELNLKKKRAEQKYHLSQNIIEQARRDLSKLRVSEETNRELISEKEQTIHEQETIMKALLKRDSNSQSIADRNLKTTDIYKRFERLSVLGHQPTQEEWILMERQLYHTYPGFKEFIIGHDYLLNDKERKTCLLVRADFKPKNIGYMLGVAPSYISSIRTDMLRKLFCLSGNSKAFDKIIKGIY